MNISSIEDLNSELLPPKANSLKYISNVGLRSPDAWFIFPDEVEYISKHFTEFSNNISPNFNCKNADIISLIAKLQKNNITHLAIRSAFYEEDGASLSYAGQFKSFLNVTPKDIPKAVRDCYFSSNSLNVNAYSGRSSVERVKCGVIIQKMVNAKISGVAFSCSSSNKKIVNQVFEWTVGLGTRLMDEQIVDGRAWLDLESNKLKIDYITDKVFVDHLLLYEVSDALKRLEAYYQDADVEWCWDGHDLHFVQARPVTASIESQSDIINPVALPRRPFGGWTRNSYLLFDLWEEYNPEAISTLDYELIYRDFWQATIETLSDENLIPSCDDFVSIIDKTPVGVDPNAPSRVNIESREPMSLCSIEMWEIERNRWEFIYNKSLQKFHEECARCGDMYNLMLEFAKSHLEICVTRIKNMTWTAKIHDLTKTISTRHKIPDHQVLVQAKSNTIDEVKNLRAFYNQLKKSGLSEKEILDKASKKYGHLRVGDEFLFESPHVLELIFESFKYVPPGKSEYPNIKQDVDFEELCLWVKIRETTKTEQDKLRALFWKSALNLGERLSLGRNIKFLTKSELSTLISNRAADYSDVIERRKQIYHSKANMPWLPRGFVDHKRNSQYKLFGETGSPGCSSGKAVIIRGLENFGKLKNGDIIVAKSTNPAWTPLFRIASGVVVENASLLSHAVIVARELRIPCLINVSNATLLVEENMEYILNANAGLLLSAVEEYRYRNGDQVG